MPRFVQKEDLSSFYKPFVILVSDSNVARTLYVLDSLLHYLVVDVNSIEKF